MPESEAESHLPEVPDPTVSDGDLWNCEAAGAAGAAGAVTLKVSLLLHGKVA